MMDVCGVLSGTEISVDDTVRVAHDEIARPVKLYSIALPQPDGRLVRDSQVETAENGASEIASRLQSLGSPLANRLWHSFRSRSVIQCGSAGLNTTSLTA